MFTMKRLFVLFLSLFLIIGSAAADPVDLSGMSFDELVALRDQLNLAIWNSQEWQEVTIPAGVWKVGEDIPAGHWHITLPGSLSTTTVYYFEKLDKAGLSFDPLAYFYFDILSTPDMESAGFSYGPSVDIAMTAGWYFLNDMPVIFTPYAGKPDLGFK